MFKFRAFLFYAASVSILGILATWFFLQHELNNETRRSLDLRIEGIARVASQTNASMGTRGLVEILGKELAEDHIVVSHNGAEEFRHGTESLFSICSTKDAENLFPLSPSDNGAVNSYRITVCRKMAPSTLVPVVLTFFIFILLWLFFRLLKNAEVNAVSQFNKFLFDNALKVKSLSRLEDIFSVLDKLDSELKKNEMATKVLAKETAFGALATQFVHDISPWIFSLKVFSKGNLAPTDSKEVLDHLISEMTKKRKSLLEHRKNSVSGGETNGLTGSEIFEVVSREVNRLFLERFGKIEGLKIDFEEGERNPLTNTYVCEEVELLSLVRNLVINAFEAKKTSQPIPELELILRATHTEATLSVVDNGVGISEKVQKKLFNEGSTFNKATGSGFGLWGVRKTLNTWGGTISIHSVEGVSTSVIVSLPVKT
jgi:signal transduction histidine kinase